MSNSDSSWHSDPDTGDDRDQGRTNDHHGPDQLHTTDHRTPDHDLHLTTDQRPDPVFEWRWRLQRALEDSITEGAETGAPVTAETLAQAVVDADLAPPPVPVDTSLDPFLLIVDGDLIAVSDPD